MAIGVALVVLLAIMMIARRSVSEPYRDPRTDVPMRRLWHRLARTSSPGNAAAVSDTRREVAFHGGDRPLVLEHRVTRVVMAVKSTRRQRANQIVEFRDPFEMLARGATDMLGVALHPILQKRCQVQPTTSMLVAGQSAAGLANFKDTLARVEASGLTSAVPFGDLDHHDASKGALEVFRTSEVAKFADVVGLTVLGESTPSQPFQIQCVLRRPVGVPTYIGIWVSRDALIISTYRSKGRERSSAAALRNDGNKRTTAWLKRYRNSNGRLGDVAVLRGAPVDGPCTVALEFTSSRVRAFVRSTVGDAKAAYTFMMPRMLPDLSDFATSPTNPMQLAYWGGPGLQRIFTAPMGDLTGAGDGPDPPVRA